MPRLILAMPLGPPFGGMTEYAAMLRRFADADPARVAIFDTTPPTNRASASLRLGHAFRNLLRLVRLVRRHRAEVVYFMTSDYLGFFEKAVMALCCRALGARVTLHLVGGFTEFYSGAGGASLLIRALLRRMDSVITVNPRVQRYVQQVVPGARVVLVPNPVDSKSVEPAAHAARDVVQVLFSGALVRRKGVLELIEAAARFREHLREARIVMIGSGPLAAECAELVAAQGLQPLVTLPGWVSDEEKRRLLRDSDIYCLPSHSEGTPISVLEAMAAQLPVVATTVGGIPAVVRNGVDGWLVPPGDSESLGRALVSLIDSPRLRSAMGASGRARVRDLFDIDVVSELLGMEFVALAAPTMPNEPSDTGVS